AASAGAQVARALAGIHRLGLAHRDIKPANIMVDEEGRATVLDFGTVRFGAAADSSSELMGTVAYMAPEQRVGLPHNHQVDLYALGVTLLESLSGVPAAHWKPGRRRRSLALLGAPMPLALAGLVDRLLSLDPAARPSAEEAESVLAAIAEGETLASVPWPPPSGFVGDATDLLDGNFVVWGRPGTGRRRLVQEARWQWYRRGYRSIGGVCVPDRPFSALRDVLRSVFDERDPDVRRTLAGVQAPLLHTVWPELPVPVARPADWPPDPAAVADAIAAVLDRIAPVAIVLWDADDADIGTAAVLPHLAKVLPDRVRLWATSRHPLADLPERQPMPWQPEQEAAALQSLLPPGTTLPGPQAGSPLESCARAWRALASWRGETGPVLDPHPSIHALSILEESFP
ncbi:MAG: protein kinase, partial [Myxococcota bacterium]|nr:protein kinase [Myxococcota bacterium]